jgi:hypothetical protein
MHPSARPALSTLIVPKLRPACQGKFFCNVLKIQLDTLETLETLETA